MTLLEETLMMKLDSHQLWAKHSSLKITEVMLGSGEMECAMDYEETMHATSPDR